jgi:hypothetical protein
LPYSKKKKKKYFSLIPTCPALKGAKEEAKKYCNSACAEQSSYIPNHLRK